MLIPIALTLDRRYWLAAPFIVALLLTQSIGALVSLLIAFIIYYHALNQLKKKELLLLLILAIAISVVFFIRASTHNQSFQPFFSSTMRLNYWRDTFLIIKAHPWMGVGLGNFDLYNTRYSHNTYLQLWAEIGILGLAAFSAIIIVILKEGFDAVKENPDKIKTAGLLCSSFAFLIHNFIDFTFFLPEVSLIWFIILGLLCNRSKPIKI